MNFGFYPHVFCELLCWLAMANMTAGITLTITPSGDIAEDETVTLQCELDLNPIFPIFVSFFVQPTSTSLCTLEPNNGVCKRPCDIDTPYSASCPSNTRYSIQFTVTRDWNGVSVVCQSASSQSNSVVFSVKVPVTSVTLTPTSNSVIGGQLMNLTCTTSYCNPPANISLYKSSDDITSQSTSITENLGGLVKTVSWLQTKFVKNDNGKQVYCRASNIPSQTVTSSILILNVMYKPEVSSSTPSPYRVIERQPATLTCTVTDANPNTGITWRWIKTDSSNTVLHNGPTYTIPSITRERSGSYSCTASNSVGTSEAATIEVDAQYKPSIEEKAVMIVNETERAVLSREIFSNPLSNVSWYKGIQLLKLDIAVNRTQLIIEKAVCADTKNFTLVASNALEWTVTSLVELIVNCKPLSHVSNITLGISEDTTFAFSATVIAYPEPRYVLLFENGTKYSGIVNSMTVNAVNNFTIHFNKTFLEKVDYGTYHLNISNMFGATTVYVNLLATKNKQGNSSSEKVECRTLDEIGNHTSLVAGSIGGTLALITLVFIIVFLVHRRYTCTCIIKFEKRKRGKTMKENKEASPYTTMTGQEHTERNMYDELTQNESPNQYEAVLITESEANDAKFYEKLRKIDSIDNPVLGDGHRNILQATGSSKQLQHMTGTTNEYMNTSFME